MQRGRAVANTGFPRARWDYFSPRPLGQGDSGDWGVLALHSARPHRVWAGQDWFREVKGEVLGWPWEFLSHFRDFFSVERI